MDSKSAIDYLTHVDWRDSRLGLERMFYLLDKLDNPQNKLKYVHIAGTNGKGSTAVMLMNILKESGCKTGLYTSPFICRFNERIQINGQHISDEELVEFTGRVKAVAEQMEDHPTEFELITVVAFLYFVEKGVDIVVLEVGMGGRLDATNVIPAPEVALIMPVSLEHTAELGSTVDKIAGEKAGIIKPGAFVVSAPQEAPAMEVIRQTCEQLQAPLTRVDTAAIRRKANTREGQTFDFGELKNLKISLLGAYQPENAAAAVTAARLLAQKGFPVSEQALRQGLAQAQWPARFEIVHQNPTVIVDGGHNPQCINSIVQNLNTYFEGREMIFLLGVMADKDYRHMFTPALPLAKRIITVTPDNPRALSADALADALKAAAPHAVVQSAGDVIEGLQAALNAAQNEEVICAFGSFFMAGPLRKYFGLA